LKEVLDMRLILLLLLVFTVIAGATDVRAQNDDPVKAMAKATFWGGVIGLALGGAAALVSDGNEQEVITWGFVLGVFGGFGFGVYHVMSNDHRAYGLLDYDSGTLSLRVPDIGLSREGPPDQRSLTGRVTLFATGF